MPIAQARKICPDLVLADGEDLTLFRNVSKRLYALLRSYSWNAKVERLGLDEMFLDVTDMVSYNVELLNRNALQQSFFCLSRVDPQVGFEYDATSFAGCCYGGDGLRSQESLLYLRLLVASHLTLHLRQKIEEEGYTTSCGISTNKLLAKLVGDKNKPRNQTALLALCQEDVHAFMDEHSLRKVPGIGGMITRTLEGFVLGKDPDPNMHTMECSTTVGQVRSHPAISPSSLSRLLSGRGLEKNLGPKVWALLHGVDDGEVKPARDVPTQISIEDTYRGLNHPSEIHRALLAITTSLLRRMHTDLLEEGEGGEEEEEEEEGDDEGNDKLPGHTAAITAKVPSSAPPSRRWLARPRTIRLTTRPYTSPQDDRPYNWGRASRSCPLPSFVLNTSLPRDERAARLVAKILLPLFHKLNPLPPPVDTPSISKARPGHGPDVDNDGAEHDDVVDDDSTPAAPPPPPPGGWNIGLLNVCVTNMSGAGAGVGDIGEMFRRQEEVLREFTVYDPPQGAGELVRGGKIDDDGLNVASQELDDRDAVEEEDGGSDVWDDDDGGDNIPVEEDLALCPVCDRLLPRFAMPAHERYHILGNT
ncbi:hypothetical protein C7999DRAFT_37389 [Corynascus novoguineensis]|uniref:UmuC domain-containing protein n=1 Tax=Corynascus novoguineensis TaxID=1126955 RepID=A0AAN7D0B4_9PEZI|nr:hypothetical protein C7999DRAFT_37389 [Corynascus novoguineensis]